MRRERDPKDLIAFWTLLDSDWQLVANKSGAIRYVPTPGLSPETFSSCGYLWHSIVRRATSVSSRAGRDQQFVVAVQGGRTGPGVGGQGGDLRVEALLGHRGRDEIGQRAAGDPEHLGDRRHGPVGTPSGSRRRTSIRGRSAASTATATSRTRVYGKRSRSS